MLEEDVCQSGIFIQCLHGRQICEPFPSEIFAEFRTGTTVPDFATAGTTSTQFADPERSKGKPAHQTYIECGCRGLLPSRSVQQSGSAGRVGNLAFQSS